MSYKIKLLIPKTDVVLELKIIEIPKVLRTLEKESENKIVH